MFCPQCGTKVAEDAAFCPSCGYALKKETTQSVPKQGNLQKEETKEETKEPVQRQAPAEAPETPILPNEVTGPEKVQGKEQLKRMLKGLPVTGWVYIAIIVILLSLIHI